MASAHRFSGPLPMHLGIIRGGAIAVVICLASGLALADKQDARDFWTGASVVGGAAIAAGGPETPWGAAGVGACVGQGIGFMGMGIWDRFFSSSTRPTSAPANTQVASVTPSALAPIPAGGPVQTTVNASIATGNQILDESRLLDMSLTRYYGALADSNASAAFLQRQQATQHLLALESALSTYRSDLMAINAAVQGVTQFTSLVVTPSDVLNLRDQIVAFGFPSYEQPFFSQMLATPEETSLAIGEVALATGAALGGNSLTGAEIFAHASDALGKINLRELMPSGFNLVPEPSTWLMGMLGTLALVPILRRRAT